MNEREQSGRSSGSMKVSSSGGDTWQEKTRPRSVAEEALSALSALRGNATTAGVNRNNIDSTAPGESHPGVGGNGNVRASTEQLGNIFRFLEEVIRARLCHAI